MRAHFLHLGRLAVALATSLAAADAARAMEFTVRAPVIFALGDIKNGDQYTFKKLLAAAPEGQIKVVALASAGGFVHAAGEIGREIREKGLATLVDAGSSHCISACTILFAAGTRRFYINAGGVVDGAVKHSTRGLGFHSGSSSSSLDANHYSGAGTGQVVGWYYEFGVSGAAALATAAPPDAVYMLSGQKALSLGIATSLGNELRGDGGKGKRR